MRQSGNMQGQSLGEEVRDTRDFSMPLIAGRKGGWRGGEASSCASRVVWSGWKERSIGEMEREGDGANKAGGNKDEEVSRSEEDGDKVDWNACAAEESASAAVECLLADGGSEEECVDASSFLRFER